MTDDIPSSASGLLARTADHPICHETAERLKGWQDWYAGAKPVR